MSSECFCDTQDWSNGALPSQEKTLQFKIYLNRKQFFNIVK